MLPPKLIQQLTKKLKETTYLLKEHFWELARTYLGNPRRWTEITANPREDGTLIRQALQLEQY